MSICFWYKNAAVIGKEHPMIAGFFRLKDRSSRRPGFAIDRVAVHLWKRAKEVFHLFIAWAKFLKEMEEVWLQTRKKSEKEERWLEEAQRIQGEIWQALKIAEWQKAYSNAKSTLPPRAKALLDPFEELSSKILFSRKDLDAFLRQWQGLQSRSEEHTSELQSQSNLVCRLLLEKKNMLHFLSLMLGSVLVLMLPLLLWLTPDLRIKKSLLKCNWTIRKRLPRCKMRLKKRLLAFSRRLHARIGKTRYMHKMSFFFNNRRTPLLSFRPLRKSPPF